jgi:hypothetical protein
MDGVSCVSPPGGWGAQKPPLGVPIDRSHPLAASLIGFWPFNEGSGGVVRDLASDIAGTVQGGTLSSGDLNCNAGVYATLPPTPLLQPAQLSVAARVSLSSGSITQIGKWIFSGPHDDINAFGYDLYLYSMPPSQPRVRFNIYESGATSPKYAQTVILSRGMHDVVGTFDGATVRIYLDGLLQSTTGSASGIAYTGSPAKAPQIGKLDTYSWFGAIQYAAIWSRALNSNEVRLLATQPYCMFAADSPYAADDMARPRIDAALASDTPLLETLA